MPPLLSAGVVGVLLFAPAGMGMQFSDLAKSVGFVFFANSPYPPG